MSQDMPFNGGLVPDATDPNREKEIARLREQKRKESGLSDDSGSNKTGSKVKETK